MTQQVKAGGFSPRWGQIMRQGLHKKGQEVLVKASFQDELFSH